MDNFCQLADYLLQHPVLAAECSYMATIYVIDFLELIYEEGKLPEEVCTFFGACKCTLCWPDLCII